MNSKSREVYSRIPQSGLLIVGFLLPHISGRADSTSILLNFIILSYTFEDFTRQNVGILEKTEWDTFFSCKMSPVIVNFPYKRFQMILIQMVNVKGVTCR